MTYLESLCRFIGWWIINIDMLLVTLIVLGGLLVFLKHSPFGRTLIFVGVSGFVFLSCVPIGLWTLELLENRFPKQTALPSTTKGLILLGGSFDLSTSRKRQETAYNIAAGRLIHFVQLAKKYPSLKRVFTGTPLEVTLAKKEFSGLGLDPDTVLYENAATNTSTNASNLAALLQPSPEETWALVTSACHMPRSVGLFRKVGFKVSPFPVDYHTTGEYEPYFLIGLRLNLNAWYAGMREFFGAFTNFITGRSDTFFPSP